MKNDLWNSLLFNLLTGLTAFLFVPIIMIGNNPEDYAFIEIFTLLKYGLLHSILLGLCLSTLSFLLCFFKSYKSSIFMASCFFIWVLLSGLIFPLTISTGMISPIDIPTNYTNLYTLISIVPILAFLNISKFAKYVRIFAFTILLVSIPTAILSIANSSISSGDQSGISLSNKKNIIIVSFDGMPGDIIYDLLKTNPNFSHKLKDFTNFINVVSQSPSTDASIIGEVYGIQDFKAKGITQELLEAALKDEGLTDKALFNNVDDSFHYGYGKISDKIIKFGSEKNRNILTEEVFLYSIVRIWTKEGVKLFKRPNQKDKIQTTYLPVWARATRTTMSYYDDFVSNLIINGEDFSIRFLHFTFTHFPVKYDELCKDRTYDKAWYDSNQNKKGIRNQDTCAIKKFIGLIDKMKELKIYDNSLIVFKSDHGKPTSYFSTYPNNLKINNSKEWGYSRYRPTLLIKDFNTNQQKINIRSNLVLLNDLSKTLCEKSDINIACDKITGVNLLDSSVNDDTPYYLYVPRSSKSTWNYQNHISVKIPSRKMSLIEAMEKSKLIILSNENPTKYSYDFKTDIKGVYGDISSMSWVNGKLKLEPRASIGNEWMQIRFTTKIGKRYVLKFDYTKGTATKKIISIGDGFDKYSDTYASTIDPSVNNSITFTSIGTKTSFFMYASTTGNAYYDNISIKELSNDSAH